MANIESIIFFLVLINIVFLFLSTFAFETFAWVNPVVIYDNVKMNWFGVILLTIIIHLLFSVVAILYWLYKLVTVGRK